jgi:hypothetical protein
MALIDEMLQELRAKLPESALPLEGALDFRGTHNFSQAGQDLAEEGREAFSTWKTDIEASITALQILKDKGYPEDLSFEADDPVLADLDAQILSMQAFRARVKKKNPPAVAVKVSVSAPEKQ